MQQGAAAYAATARVTATANPRDLEAHLLIKSAARLQGVRDQWGNSRQPNDFVPALNYNRKLWTILGTSATQDSSPLDQDIKNNIGSLAVFVFKRTLELEIDPVPEKMNILIQINRSLAAGLSTK